MYWLLSTLFAFYIVWVIKNFIKKCEEKKSEPEDCSYYDDY